MNSEKTVLAGCQFLTVFTSVIVVISVFFFMQSFFQVNRGEAIGVIETS